MVGAAIMEDDVREPGAIAPEDEPFDVVRSKSSESNNKTSPAKTPSYLRQRARAAASKTATRTTSYDVGDLPTLGGSRNINESSTMDVRTNKPVEPQQQQPSSPPDVDDSPTALTRNVTGGRSAYTRPMSPPSRAGLDDPEIYQRSKGSRKSDRDDYTEEPPSTMGGSSAYTGTSGTSSYEPNADEMPMDEQRDYEDEMNALALCDVGEGSQGMPEFCESAMQAVNQMCAGVTGGEAAVAGPIESSPEGGSSSPSRKPRWPNLRLGTKHSPSDSGVEEHTAIEVEYVEPNYRGKNDASSPKRKNALLKAMTRSAREKYGSGRKQKQQQQDEAQDPSAGNESGDVYSTFTNAEKRKFLQLINGGTTPFDATNRVLRERIEGGTRSYDGSSVADSSFQSDIQPPPAPSTPARSTASTNRSTPGSSGKKSRKLAFWKRGKKNNNNTEAVTSPQDQSQEAREQVIVSPPGTPRRYAGANSNDEDDDDNGSSSSYENVGEEIKKFLRDEAESVASEQKQQQKGQRRKGEEDVHRFEKSGINYYDAVRKNDIPDEDADEYYYNDGEYPADDDAGSKRSRKIKMPFKGSLQRMRDRNRAAPVPDDAEDAGNDKEVERIASSAKSPNPPVLESHVSINSPSKEHVRTVSGSSPANAAAVAPQSSSFDDEEKKTEEDPRGGGSGNGGAIEDAIAARLKGVDTHQMPDVDDDEEGAEETAANRGSHFKSAEEIVEDLNMDAYLGNRVYNHSDTASRDGGVNSRSFDGTSVVSGKSYKTNATQSTRSRRPGQAKIRLEQKKNFISSAASVTSSVNSIQHKSWQDSIEAVAAKIGKEWDPVNGWKGYVDPNRVVNVDSYGDSVADFKGGESTTTTEVVLSSPAQLTAWRDTRKPDAKKSRPVTSSSGSIQNSKSPSRSRRSPGKVTTPARDDKPRGWAATMKAATAKLNLQGGKKWDPEIGWVGLTQEEARGVTGSGAPHDGADASNQNNVAVTAESDLQDFGTLNQLDAIASKNDRSLQFLSEDEDADYTDKNAHGENETHDGDLSSSAGKSKQSADVSRYMQIGDTGSVHQYQRAAQGGGRGTTNVRRESLNKHDAGFFPDGSVHRGARKGPVDTDDIYEEEHQSSPREKLTVIKGPDANKTYRKLYETSNQDGNSFDAGTDFSWDADEATETMDNTLENRNAVAPRLKIKIRDAVASTAAPNPNSTKAQSEASYESAGSSTIPKLAAPKRDTSPIRGGNNRRNSSIVTPPSEPFEEVQPNALDEPTSAKQQQQQQQIQEMPQAPPEFQPIQDYGPVEKLSPMKRLQTIDGGAYDEHAAEVAHLVERITPTVTANDPRGSPKVSELHRMWEKRTKSWDKDQRDLPADVLQLSPSQRDRTENPEWRQFLEKKVQAERAAANNNTERTRDDTVFDFDNNSQRQQMQQQHQSKDPPFGHGDDLSELSPIRHDASDSESNYTMSASEASTAVLQGTTFLQRLQACAAPIASKGAQLARSQGCTTGGVEGGGTGGPISAHLAFLRQNPNVGTSSPEKKSLMQRTAGLCGRPDIIPEDEDLTLATERTEESRSRSGTPRKSRSNTPTKSRKPKDDMSSVVSDGFGSQSAYLEVIAMKAAVSGKKKKKRPTSQQPGDGAGSEVSYNNDSRPGSEANSTDTGTSKHSQKFQQFLDRRASKGEASTSPSNEQLHQKPPRGDASADPAEQQVSATMESMTGTSNKGRTMEDYEETGAFPTLPDGGTTSAAGASSATRAAAEDLAAARVEAMMQRLSTQSLEDHEAEI